MTELAFVLALVFSPVAALSAYLITYGEYKKHFPEDPKRARKFALNFALSTLLFFAVLIILAVLIIGRMMPK